MDDESGDDERDGLTSDEEVNQDMTGEADEMNLGDVSKTRWCISKSMCEFQGRGGWWARKSDNR